jgi:hypothetical protein
MVKRLRRRRVTLEEKADQLDRVVAACMTATGLAFGGVVLWLVGGSTGWGAVELAGQICNAAVRIALPLLLLWSAWIISAPLVPYRSAFSWSEGEDEGGV